MEGGTTVCDVDGIKRCHGFVLVAVLWILVALATLSITYALYVHQTWVDFSEHDQRLQAQAFATSGVELAVYQLTKNLDDRPLEGQFVYFPKNAVVTVTFRSENSRIDLNGASGELIAGLFNGLGATSDEAHSYADRIVAWRTPVKPGQSDPEKEIYQRAGKRYGPRHGPFQHPDEIALVAGIPSQLIESTMPYVTVYSGRPEVNVLVAAPQVLAALPGMTPQRLERLLTARSAGPEAVAKAQLGGATSSITQDSSRTNRVSVDIKFRSGRRMQVEAVVMLMEGDSQPYRIVSWADGIPIVGEHLGIR